MGREGICLVLSRKSNNTILLLATAVRHSSGIAFPPSMRRMLNSKSLKTSGNDVASATTHPYHRFKGPALVPGNIILKNNKWLAVFVRALWPGVCACAKRKLGGRWKNPRAGISFYGLFYALLISWSIIHVLVAIYWTTQDWHYSLENLILISDILL